MAARDLAIKSATGTLSYFARHRTAANLLLVVMVTLGLLATTKIRSQYFPDVIIESVSVSVRWQGAGPEDIDAGIVQLLEPALLAVEGVESSDATATEGSARIRLSFEPSWDMARAAEDVKAAVDTVGGLPSEAEEPTVRRAAWRDRVTDVVITGPVSADQLARFADEFVVLLFREGVTRATVRGVAAPETVIEVEEAVLIQNDVTLREIANAIAEEADADPAGDVAGGAARVRTGVAKRTADQIGEVAIRSNPDGSKLFVRDVATIRVEGIDRNRSYFVGPHPAVIVGVDRSDKGDAIGMQASVQSVADELQLSMPEGVKIDLIRTRAEAITGRLNILLENGSVGLLMVIALLFLFLNARTAIWVAAGIPVAMLAAIALMYAFGLTLNMVSLFALIICLGIVVDDAIVVGEHADFRARRLGESPIEAAENAAKRMSLPVFSATLTTIIAFFGLVAIGGRFGSLIADIPFTVIVVLLASLLECFLILPHHMSHALEAAKNRRWYDWPSHVFNIFFTWFREAIFRRLMAVVIWARYVVVAGAILILASQVVLFISGEVNWRFFNSPERGSISGNFAMLPAADRSDTIEMMREMQRATEALGKKYEEEHGLNPLDFVMAEIGGTSGRGLASQGTKDADLLGGISIELIDADLRSYSSFEFLGALQETVNRHPLLETLSFRGWRSGPGGDALNVQFYGADLQQLKDASEALKTAVTQFAEVSAVEDNLAYDKEELVLELTPQGQALGFTIDGIGRILRDRLNGITAATYPVGARSAEINVQLPSGELTADYLDRTMMRSPTGNYVPLADIVKTSTKVGFASVLRENGLRVITVSGDISEDDPKRAEEIVENIRSVILPQIESDYGVGTRLGGLAEQESEFLTDALLGLSLCLVGIYLTLAWIFASWTRPVVVMAVIPFGLVGTIYGHHVWDVPLSMFTVVGLIGMTGIIINDSIVLVTTIDEYAENRDMRTAILDGTADRLRPVVLTTLTTVLGLAPLLFEKSEQAQFLMPTVITLCYGLGFGLFLVLLIVPSLIAMQQDASRRKRAFWRAMSSRRLGFVQSAVLYAATFAAMGLFAGTVGYYAVYREVFAPVANMWSEVAALPDLPAGVTAFAMFAVGTAVICLIGLILSAIASVARRRAA